MKVEKLTLRIACIYCYCHKRSTLSIENHFLKKRTILWLESHSFSVISKMTELKVREMLNVHLPGRR